MMFLLCCPVPCVRSCWAVVDVDQDYFIVLYTISCALCPFLLGCVRSCALLCYPVPCVRSCWAVVVQPYKYFLLYPVPCVRSCWAVGLYNALYYIFNYPVPCVRSCALCPFLCPVWLSCALQGCILFYYIVLPIGGKRKKCGGKKEK